MDKLQGEKKDLKVLAVEPTACPTLTRGIYAYDHGDTVGLVPLVRMYTLGHTFVPPPIHSGGLRYHGDAPLLCLLLREGVIEATAYHQNAVFEAAIQFAQAEGYIAAPETAHAVKAAIDEALANPLEIDAEVVEAQEARRILEEAGFGEYIQHRLGHGMDRALHGFGPNLDAVETRDERELLPGIGFSVEPGVYLPGRFGVRSEINVHLRADGPEVTTPRPQKEPWPGRREGSG
jgi:hypothetical protein